MKKGLLWGHLAEYKNRFQQGNSIGDSRKGVYCLIYRIKRTQVQNTDVQIWYDK